MASDANNVSSDRPVPDEKQMEQDELREEISNIILSLVSWDALKNQLKTIVISSLVSKAMHFMKRSAINGGLKVTGSLARIAMLTLRHSYASMVGVMFQRFALAYVKFITGIATGVGIFLGLSGFADLICLGWDWADSKQLGDEKFVNAYSIMSMMQNEQVYGYKTMEYSPAMFIEHYNSRGSERV